VILLDETLKFVARKYAEAPSAGLRDSRRK